MSTVSGTASTFTGPPRPTGNGGNGGGGDNGAGAPGAPSISAPSSLYLITFAVTLSLLLSVSCAILARNVVLRARERRLRAAVAAGLVLEPDLAVRHGIGLRAGAARPVGERPVRWDAWMPEKPAGRAVQWPDFVPVSVAALPSPTAPPPAPPPPPPPPIRRTLFERIFQLPPLPRIPSAAEQQQQQQQQPKTEEPRIDLEAQRGVRVAVLVAMPSTQHNRDGELPEVLFGTSDVVWSAPPPSPKL